MLYLKTTQVSKSPFISTQNRFDVSLDVPNGGCPPVEMAEVRGYFDSPPMPLPGVTPTLKQAEHLLVVGYLTHLTPVGNLMLLSWWNALTVVV